LARQKALRKDHRQHLINARRCAVGCAMKVQELRPKTKEELEEEEEWENRRLYKETVAGLKKKWSAITQVLNLEINFKLGIRLIIYRKLNNERYSRGLRKKGWRVRRTSSACSSSQQSCFELDVGVLRR